MFDCRKLLQDYFRATEPEAVAQRKARCLKRRQFYCAGNNDIWRFGLWLHIVLEPHAGLILWLKIWWTNRNPRLIASYYLEAARKKQGIPLVTQSDLGSENYGVANCHTELRQYLDPSLAGTLQHHWMRKNFNVKPEIAWGLLCRTWIPGFEDILDEGHLNGLYDPNNPLEKLVFLWLAIPWLQAELDAYVELWNNTAPRADKNKILPHGIPNHISEEPWEYDALDFKVNIVDPEIFDEAERKWAPPDAPCFQCVPPEFDDHAHQLYDELGRPQISSDSFWDVYTDLLEMFRLQPEIPDYSSAPQSQAYSEEDNIELLPGMQALRLGKRAVGNNRWCYAGGLENPPLPSALQSELAQDDSDNLTDHEENDARYYVQFSDDEPVE
ncbi:hypothetical protein CERSUDRAFT_63618 [Gelatoporia subvermispora B]|uniref:Integrase core domain-containing protein n=1 Tax=Ceriporiopsis subvermispora (strain B) TaxID=914234 RepID=M2PTS9_CERS8|nr:hypothetical protein CERSUDRAFT_63618 [Gelatoporia subvermispora B]